jgi:phosphohistidine swiveling domain-containing protein
VLRRLLGDKAVKMVFVEGITKQTTRNIPASKADRGHFCLGDEDVLELADYAVKIERHYGRPMDMEWAKDGIDGRLYVVQARPETVASQHNATTLESYQLQGSGEVLVEGRSVGRKIASGSAHLIENVAHLHEFKPGEVLIADTTTPDWEPVMKTAAALVTNRGGRTCHAAIIARELGIPAVVGSRWPPGPPCGVTARPRPRRIGSSTKGSRSATLSSLSWRRASRCPWRRSSRWSPGAMSPPPNRRWEPSEDWTARSDSPTYGTRT